MHIVEPDIITEHNGIAVASGTQSTVILGPIDLLRYPTRSFSVYNMGTLTLSGVIVQINPDIAGFGQGSSMRADGTTGPPPNPGLWVDYDTTSLRNVPSGGVQALTLPGLYRWWRFVGTNDRTPDVTASGYLYAASVV